MNLTEWGGSNWESETGFPRAGHGCMGAAVIVYGEVGPQG